MSEKKLLKGVFRQLQDEENKHKKNLKTFPRNSFK
jgi:hypothetical protein